MQPHLALFDILAPQLLLQGQNQLNMVKLIVANAQKRQEYKNTKPFWGICFLSASFYATNRIPHVSKVTDDQLVNSKMLFLQPLIGIQDIKYSNRLTQKTVLRRAW